MDNMTESNPSSDGEALHRDHRRQWRDCRYVYPVISRRARGLSIGVNLNPDKSCNYSCRYCQINRRQHRQDFPIDLGRLREELELALAEADTGRLWEEPRFAPTPPEQRRINDIAFSGDGEPTCREDFDQAVAVAADARQAAGLEDVKLVVITNASALRRPAFERALEILDANHGEIWAKLDAGTEARFQFLNRPAPGVYLEKVVEDIAHVAHFRPVVIQTLMPRVDGAPPLPDEVDAYIDRLRTIIRSGGRIQLVQLHTIARSPADGRVSALSDAELDALAGHIRGELPDVPLEVYYGADVPPQS